MKVIAALFVALCIGAAAALPQKQLPNPELSHALTTELQAELGGNFECNVCIQLSEQIINVLLNEILNGVVVGGCSDLCGKLPTKVEQTVCDLGCTIYGIEEFIKILSNTDIDPIWYCEIVRMCPIKDCQGTCLTIDDMSVVPATGPVGTVFETVVHFTVTNETGTGEIITEIFPPNGGVPLSNGQLVSGFELGHFNLTVSLDTSQPESDDDIVGPQPFTPGDYIAQIWFCEGECGSKHPHSKTLAREHQNFTLTAAP